LKSLIALPALTVEIYESAYSVPISIPRVGLSQQYRLGVDAYSEQRVELAAQVVPFMV